MKLERVLRKAAPFLLIAILIACLFSMPQKEGMKGAKKWFEEDHGKHAEDTVVGSMITATTAAATGVGYMTVQGHQFEREERARQAAAKQAYEGSQEQREDWFEALPKRDEIDDFDDNGKAKLRKDSDGNFKYLDNNMDNDYFDVEEASARRSSAATVKRFESPSSEVMAHTQEDFESAPQEVKGGTEDHALDPTAMAIEKINIHRTDDWADGGSGD